VISIDKYAGLNLKELTLLGKGTQGKVYKIDSQKCIKIFKSKLVCKNELQTLMMAQADVHFPRLYSAGDDFIIRECINGTELNRYLANNPLTPWVSNRIINLYESMSKVGYNRLDSAIFHIFITPSGELKLIDTAKALKKKTVYPRLILNGLDNLGYKEEFLDFVNAVRPDLYRRWQ
jgi:predicted Ser/Thr protein kinase